MGTLSFTGDKGSMELLFSQPVSRAAIQLGKLLGLFASIAISTLAGFVIAGTIILNSSGTEGLGPYAAFVLLSLLLSLVFLSLSVLVATLNSRKSKAFGVSLFLWFFFVLFYDLLALGGTFLFKGKSANLFLFFSLFGNPVDMVRIASLILLDDVTIFGAAGAALLRFFGGGLASLSLLLTALAAWTILPFLLADMMLRSRDI
jgi:Cu-processing system permease protein